MKNLLMLMLCAFSVQAEVISSQDHGFVLQTQTQVPVDANSAYEQFLRVHEWWDADHSWFGKAEGFTLEPHAGGCFCEKSAGKEVLHMTVSFVDPGKEIRMLGGLGPLQMMGVHGGMSWKFEDQGNNTSTITHRYHAVGYVEGGMSGLAKVVDQVQSGQLQRLADILNNKSTESKIK